MFLERAYLHVNATSLTILSADVQADQYVSLLGWRGRVESVVLHWLKPFRTIGKHAYMGPIRAILCGVYQMGKKNDINIFIETHIFSFFILYD